MGKKMTILVFIFASLTFWAQDSIDVVQANRAKDEKQNQIKLWEDQIELAKKNKDVYSEIVATIDLISFKKNNFGYNYEVYKDAVHIENLLNKFSHVDSINNLKPKLYFLMGQLLRDQSKLTESISYYKLCIEQADMINDEETKNNARTMLIYVYDINGEDEKALDLFSVIEKEAIKTRNSKLESKINEVIAHLYFDKKDYENAFRHIRKSLLNSESKAGSSYRNSFMARLFLTTIEEMDSAIIYGERALRIAQENQLLIEELYAHENLKDAYFRIGDYQKALHHFQRFYELEQKQRSFDEAIQIGKVNIEKEKEEASLKQALADQKLSNQRLVIWVVSVALLLLTFGVLFIVNRLKFISKQSKIIEQEKMRAEQSERYKERFLANMSHEVRTPMHAISGMINTLKRENHPSSQDTYLDAMKTSADNLLLLLNDVLDMSKIESGNLEIRQVQMNVIEIVQQIVKLYQDKAEEKGLLLKAHIANDFPKTTMGDPGRLNQILMNLVSNAIKFTEKGQVQICLSHSVDKMKFAVKDTGIGITDDQKEFVFESFKQGKNISKGFYGGTGLGLTITKQLIELQGGNIWLESEANKGSVFHFELPLLKSERMQESQTLWVESQLKALGQKLKGLKVLIAEDNEFNIMVVKDDLHWYIPDGDITIVENGNLAVKAYQKEAFDLILMDVQMPQMNGYDAARTIRELESKHQVKNQTPIIAMTASLLKDQIDRSFAAGMNGYIPKPYKPEELITTIYKTVKN